MEFGTIIWIILIGGMFYFMLKGGGCCGGHSHSSGDRKEDGSNTGESGTGTDRKHKKGCH